MVVVVLIAILAAMAVPSLVTAREDRLAFREADTFARIVHDARMKAMARGAAQLVVFQSNGTTDRGTILVFESLDATGHPQGTCRTPGQWAGAPAGSATTPITAFENLNTGVGSVQVKAGLETTLKLDGVTATVAVLCFTPGGRVYGNGGNSLPVLLTALVSAGPFTKDLVFSVLRKPNGATLPVGLTRNVIVTAAGGTRIQSQ